MIHLDELTDLLEGDPTAGIAAPDPTNTDHLDMICGVLAAMADEPTPIGRLLHRARSAAMLIDVACALANLGAMMRAHGHPEPLAVTHAHLTAYGAALAQQGHPVGRWLIGAPVGDA